MGTGTNQIATNQDIYDGFGIWVNSTEPTRCPTYSEIINAGLEVSTELSSNQLVKYSLISAGSSSTSYIYLNLEGVPIGYNDGGDYGQIYVDDLQIASNYPAYILDMSNGQVGASYTITGSDQTAGFDGDELGEYWGLGGYDSILIPVCSTNNPTGIVYLLVYGYRDTSNGDIIPEYVYFCLNSPNHGLAFSQSGDTSNTFGLLYPEFVGGLDQTSGFSTYGGNYSASWTDFIITNVMYCYTSSGDDLTIQLKNYNNGTVGTESNNDAHINLVAPTFSSVAEMYQIVQNVTTIGFSIG